MTEITLNQLSSVLEAAGLDPNNPADIEAFKASVAKLSTTTLTPADLSAAATQAAADKKPDPQNLNDYFNDFFEAEQVKANKFADKKPAPQNLNDYFNDFFEAEQAKRDIQSGKR